MIEPEEETESDTSCSIDAMKRFLRTSSGAFGWLIRLQNRIFMARSYILFYIGVLMLLGSTSSLYFKAGCSIDGRAVLCPVEAMPRESRVNAYTAPWYTDDYMTFETLCPMYPPLFVLEHEKSRKEINRREEMDHLMQEKIPWIAFVGDSIARNLLLALLVDLGAGDAKSINFERHANYEYNDPQDRFRATLHWAPFPDNATNIITSWVTRSRERRNEKPSIVVLSVSLWHILHIHSEALFEQDISILRLAMGALNTNTFVANAPEVFSTLLHDAKKKTYMIPERVDTYNKVLTESLFLNDNNSNETTSAVVLLDVFNATMVCGEPCSVDGIHSKDLVYTTLIHTFWYVVRTCF